VSAGKEEGLGATALTKDYRDGRHRTVAVCDVSLSIPRGQLWVVRGPSGAGKTTLLGLLGGVIAPTRGNVRLGGEDITHLREHHRDRLRRDRIGLVFQEAALIEGMTGRDNALLAFVPSGGARAADRRHVGRLLERFEMAPMADTKVERLSGGERQRIALVRALARRPDVLLLDEPTAFVDAESAARVMDYLVQLRDEKRTLLVATHDPALAACRGVDRVLTMRYGRVEG
jgi:putative ABC transport system ATP-binding protein